MGKHDEYGKRVLMATLGRRFSDYGDQLKIDYSGTFARIDGTINQDICVEIESRTDKQIRGALLDLISHCYPKKLLIILPLYMNDPQKTKSSCEFILKKYLSPTNFKVIIFSMSIDEDKRILMSAINELGVTA
jgi:hypothetical protein